MEIMHYRPDSHASASRELSRDEGMRLLPDVSFGRIVFISRSMPTLRLVSHVVEGQSLLIGLALESDVASLLTRVCRVVYEADLLDPATRWGWSVVLTGRAGLVEDPQEVALAHRRLVRGPGDPVDVIARIHPELVTGFRIAADGDGTAR